MTYARPMICLLVAVGLSVSSATAAESDSTALAQQLASKESSFAWPCPDLLPRVSPYQGLTFEHEKHLEWYERFWTGQCDGLSLFDGCWSGEHWSGKMCSLLSRAGTDARSPRYQALWELGRLIGHEWARDNDIRRIDTKNLEAWYNKLEDPTDLDAELKAIRIEAEAKLRQASSTK
jgi:hypothetical protein